MVEPRLEEYEGTGVGGSGANEKEEENGQDESLKLMIDGRINEVSDGMVNLLACATNRVHGSNGQFDSLTIHHV